MSNVVLAIIGILLAAAAVPMVLFYGGDAFSKRDAEAAAVAAMNVGNNVKSAYDVYYAQERRAPADLNELSANGTYLSKPTIPSTTGNINDEWFVDGRTRYFTIEIVDSDICNHINRYARRGTQILDRITGATGCAREGTVLEYFMALQRPRPTSNVADPDQTPTHPMPTPTPTPTPAPTSPVTPVYNPIWMEPSTPTQGGSSGGGSSSGGSSGGGTDGGGDSNTIIDRTDPTKPFIPKTDCSITPEATATPSQKTLWLNCYARDIIPAARWWIRSGRGENPSVQQLYDAGLLVRTPPAWPEINNISISNYAGSPYGSPAYARAAPANNKPRYLRIEMHATQDGLNNYYASADVPNKILNRDMAYYYILYSQPLYWPREYTKYVNREIEPKYYKSIPLANASLKEKGDYMGYTLRWFDWAARDALNNGAEYATVNFTAAGLSALGYNPPVLPDWPEAAQVELRTRTDQFGTGANGPGPNYFIRWNVRQPWAIEMNNHVVAANYGRARFDMYSDSYYTAYPKITHTLRDHNSVALAAINHVNGELTQIMRSVVSQNLLDRTSYDAGGGYTPNFNNYATGWDFAYYDDGYVYVMATITDQAQCETLRQLQGEGGDLNELKFAPEWCGRNESGLYYMIDATDQVRSMQRTTLWTELDRVVSDLKQKQVWGAQMYANNGGYQPNFRGHGQNLKFWEFSNGKRYVSVDVPKRFCSWFRMQIGQIDGAGEMRYDPEWCMDYSEGTRYMVEVR